MKTDWKDKLKDAVKSGALPAKTTKPATKTVAKATKKVAEGGKTVVGKKLAEAAGKKVLIVSGKSAAKAKVIDVEKKPWHERYISTVATAKHSASVIENFKSIDSPELGERLRDIRSLVTKVHAKALSEKGNGDRGVTKVRQNSETVLNYLNTVESAIETRDLEAGQLAEVCRQMQDYLLDLKDSLSTLGHKAEPMAKVDSIDGDVVAHFKSKAMLLDRTAQENADKIAFMVNLPVVPIFDGTVTPQTLLNAGLPVETMGGYAVILNQRLIALRTEKADKLKYDRETYLRRLISKIEELSAHNWTLVTETGMANAKHEVMFYWIMPGKMLDAMTNAAAGNALRQWGLAF